MDSERFKPPNFLSRRQSSPVTGTSNSEVPCCPTGGVDLMKALLASKIENANRSSVNNNEGEEVDGLHNLVFGDLRRDSVDSCGSTSSAPPQVPFHHHGRHRFHHHHHLPSSQPVTPESPFGPDGMNSPLMLPTAPDSMGSQISLMCRCDDCLLGMNDGDFFIQSPSTSFPSTPTTPLSPAASEADFHRAARINSLPGGPSFSESDASLVVKSENRGEKGVDQDKEGVNGSAKAMPNGQQIPKLREKPSLARIFSQLSNGSTSKVNRRMSQLTKPEVDHGVMARPINVPNDPLVYDETGYADYARSLSTYSSGSAACYSRQHSRTSSSNAEQHCCCVSSSGDGDQDAAILESHGSFDSSEELSSDWEDDEILEEEVDVVGGEAGSVCHAELRRKSSGWRTARKIVYLTPFFQTYKKNRYPWVQLAGHQGNFKSGEEQGTILKKLCGEEERCLRLLSEEDLLKSFVPEYKGRLVGEDGEVYLVLQDLLAEFSNPCIMDCKMGLRTYLEEELAKAREKPKLRKDMYEKMYQIDPDAPTKEEHDVKAVTKPRYMVWRETISSTATLGFRIDGIKKADGELSKDFKTTRSRAQVMEAIESFVQGFPTALREHQHKLLEIKKALTDSRFFGDHEVIGSSLLFVHDANKSGIWLIDFAKTFPIPNGIKVTHCDPWVVGNHEDGYLIGLDNLVDIFSEMSNRSSKLNNHK